MCSLRSAFSASRCRRSSASAFREATVRAFHYASIEDLRRHVRDWLLAYNYAKQLKALRFRTPLEAIQRIAVERPELFVRQPSQDMLGLNT